MENKDTFNYTYSAARQQEIKSIRDKYLPPQEDKMEQLRALHRSAGRKAQAWAITFGVAGALVMGTGMSLAMTDLGTALGLREGMAMLLGVAIGIGGMILAALAYPVYNRTLKNKREQIAPEILRLADELLK